MERLNVIKDDLQHALPEKRYNHTLGVMYTAAALAMCYNVSVEEAMLSGLLHDCAKQISTDDMKDICIKNNIAREQIEDLNPELLHAKVGAVLAQEKYGIKDEKILNAIKYHTTGKPEMDILEKIIYIADYIEPNRKSIEGLDEIRILAFSDLDKCLVTILGNTLDYLKRNNKTIDETTVKAYQYYNRR